jgi:glycosyltransferase involved in cell wall biosynthesis
MKYISVIMGVHNIDKFLDIAIKSILDQTHKEFEFIIVANGSKYMEIYEYLIKNYSYDERIVVLKSPIGQLAHALNVGLDCAKYDYIARMDADDFSYPQRFAKQLEYMDKYNLELLGVDMRLIDENDNELSISKMPKGKDINKKLPFRGCFAHNALLYKKATILKARGYNAGFNSEDYDLWLRLKRQGIAWDNMDEVLIDYRIHSGASRRRLLGYAEVAGLALREFILNKTFINFLAVCWHTFKSFVRPDKSKPQE